MKTKMEPCCARFLSVLHAEEADLRRLAWLANNRTSRGLDPGKYVSAIEEKKRQIQSVKENMTDHEAAHSGEMC